MVGGRRHTRVVVGSVRRRQEKSRHVIWLMVGALVVAVAVGTVFTVRGVRILQLRHRLEVSLLAREQALSERDVLEHQLSLSNDLTAIEDVARSELGWILPGEVRVVFIDPERSAEGE